MSVPVRVLARARQDVDYIVAWLAERSPAGAARWLDRFGAALERLAANPDAAPIAAESRDLGEEIRYILFRTRAGRPYRILFLVVGGEVRVLRVRGPGQANVGRDEVDFE